MGWLDFFLGPNQGDSKFGDFRLQKDYAEVNDHAITPDNRSTPGIYYSGDLVRATEQSGLVVTREIVEQTKQMADNMEQNVENINAFGEELKRLAKAETATTRAFGKIKVGVARQHAYQNQSHNKTLAGMDRVAGIYQENRVKRMRGSQQTRQSIAQMQQQQRILRG